MLTILYLVVVNKKDNFSIGVNTKIFLFFFKKRFDRSVLMCILVNMTKLYQKLTEESKDRKKSWECMSEPKPDWETFKRMLNTFGDVDKLRKAWLKKNRTVI